MSEGMDPAVQKLLNFLDRAKAFQPMIDLRRQIFRNGSGRPTPMPWHALGNATEMPWIMNHGKRGGLEEGLFVDMLAVALR